MKRLHLVAACLAAMTVVHGACGAGGDPMNPMAERYVKLVLALGQYDADYVDAYYGPPEWRRDAKVNPRSLPGIDADAAALEKSLASVTPAAAAEEIVRLRHTYLTKQLSALRTRITMLSGQRLTFDEESGALYDAVAPTDPKRMTEVCFVLELLPGILPYRSPPEWSYCRRRGPEKVIQRLSTDARRSHPLQGFRPMA